MKRGHEHDKRSLQLYERIGQRSDSLKIIMPQYTLGEIQKKIQSASLATQSAHSNPFKEPLTKNFKKSNSWKLEGKEAASKFCPQMGLEHASQSLWIGDK